MAYWDGTVRNKPNTGCFYIHLVTIQHKITPSNRIIWRQIKIKCMRSVDADLCRHMVSPGCNDLSSYPSTYRKDYNCNYVSPIFAETEIFRKNMSMPWSLMLWSWAAMVLTVYEKQTTGLPQENISSICAIQYRSITQNPDILWMFIKGIQRVKGQFPIDRTQAPLAKMLCRDCSVKTHISDTHMWVWQR